MRKLDETPDERAQAHGLLYYADDQPGILRRRCGRGFTYLAADGTRITDKSERARLAAMAVPPAYDNVWMAPFDSCHLWATGIDDAGRKQYLYNPVWTQAQSEAKFDALVDVMDVLPVLRRWIASRLKGPATCKQTQIAVALALVDRAALRPGNDAYVDENRSYGATTLEARHVTVDGDRIALSFRGKGGTRIQQTLFGAQLARTFSALLERPGSRLFSYETDADSGLNLRPEHLNETLRDVTGADITAKDLRTWQGSLAAFSALRRGDAVDAPQVAEEAAERLQNTPAVARASYVHPKILETADNPDLQAGVRRLPDQGTAGLRRHEAALGHFLRAD